MDLTGRAIVYGNGVVNTRHVGHASRQRFWKQLRDEILRHRVGALVAAALVLQLWAIIGCCCERYGTLNEL